MTEEPSTIDGEIIEEMKSLELMIAFHKKALLRNLEPEVFLPNEVKSYLDHSMAKDLWDSQDYDAIRLAYASAWVNYYTIRFGDDVFYTNQQFANFFKTD